MLFKCVILTLVASSAWSRTTQPIQENLIQDKETARSEESSSYFGDLNYIYKMYRECSSNDLPTCLKLKLVTAMDRASKSYPQVNIVDGVSFVKDTTVPEEQALKTETEIEATLPRSIREKDNALNALIVDKISKFFETHTLQIQLPSSSELQRSFTEEARKKKKDKGGHYMLVPLMLAGAMVPIALGALALLAGKALIVSKLALVLASILGLKKLLSGSGGGHESEVVVSGGHGGSDWARSINIAKAAKKLAYSSYAPKTR